MPSSPCVGLCRIAADDLCTGCARSRAEIAAWRGLSRAALDRVWAALPARRAALGIGLHRLPWTADEIRRSVAAGLRHRSGTWTFGVPGALAEFTVGVGDAVSVSHDGGDVTARTGKGALRFTGFEEMRALAFGAGSRPEAAGVVALVVPRERAAGGPSVLTDLGADVDALDPAGRGHALFDLGFGGSASRFCVRVGDPGLRRRLSALCGAPWRTFLPELGPSLVAASPPRVVLSPVGRAEVFAPIPPPGGASPPGPHTHLLPASLDAAHEAPPALGIPAGYAVGALHYSDPTDRDGHHEP